MSAAETLAAGYASPDAEAEAPAEEVDAVVEEAPEEVEPDTADESTEEELPENIKEILSKNRKAVRAAEARAVAAEKALAAKDESPAEEAAPVDDKFKTLFINTAAKNALVEAGLTASDRFVKMIDLNSVEVDEDGTITGLEDQIAELKEDFKDLIAPKVVKKAVAKADTAGRREVVETPKTSAELLAERFRG